MSYATGSSVRLVRTNSLTIVKDLIKSFTAENKKKTVQTGMKSYFSAVTKAVCEVTGLPAAYPVSSHCWSEYFSYRKVVILFVKIKI